MKKRIGVICLGILLLISACGQDAAADSAKEEGKEQVTVNEAIVKEIKDRGRLIVGCKTDVPDLSFYDKETDTWSGLEIELAYKTAAGIWNVTPEEARASRLVEFVGVTVADREETLENGGIDIMLATYTINEQRKERFAFSESYYIDYIGMMVRDSGRDSNSLGTTDIMSVADLDGKYVGVPKKATTREAFLKYIDTMNTVKVNPIFCEYESYDALFNALKSGSIDVMAVDVSILNGYLDSGTKILGTRFGGQHYGAAVRKENAPLLTYVNRAIEEN